MNERKVLLVEDEELLVDFARDYLSPDCTLLIATTFREAEDVFAKHPDIDYAILDGRVPLGGGSRTIVSIVPFAAEVFRKTGGRVVVYSSTGDYDIDHELVALGCVSVEKHRVYKLVRDKVNKKT